MSEGEKIIEVKIFGQSFKIKCPQEETPHLLKSALYVEQQMKMICRSEQPSSALQQAAVVAALNISRELMQKNLIVEQLTQRCQLIKQKIKNSLVQTEDLLV